MQAIIMAAGKGSRLKSITENKPKSFIQIKGQKLIDYNIKLLNKYGIKDIIIVTGYREECFYEHFKNNHDVRLVWNPFYEQVNVLGSFYMGMDFLKDDFIYMHADTLCDTNIFEAIINTKADIVLPIEYGSCDDEAMKIRKEDGVVCEISKEISLDISEGEFIGIAKISKNTIDILKEHTKSVLKEGNFMAYFESAIQRMLNSEKLEIIDISVNGNKWIEIDFVEDYEAALEMISDSMLGI